MIIPKITRKEWSDEDLDMKFTILPTKENAEKLGKIIGIPSEAIILTWMFSINTRKKNETLGSRKDWAERCRKTRIRATYFFDSLTYSSIHLSGLLSFPRTYDNFFI